MQINKFIRIANNTPEYHCMFVTKYDTKKAIQDCLHRARRYFTDRDGEHTYDLCDDHIKFYKDYMAVQ